MKTIPLAVGWLVCVIGFSFWCGLASEPNNVSRGLLVTFDVVALYMMSVGMPVATSAAQRLVQQAATFEDRMILIVDRQRLMFAASLGATLLWAVLSLWTHKSVVPRYILGIPATTFVISFGFKDIRRDFFAAAVAATLAVALTVMCLTLLGPP